MSRRATQEHGIKRHNSSFFNKMHMDGWMDGRWDGGGDWGGGGMKMRQNKRRLIIEKGGKMRDGSWLKKKKEAIES